MNMHAPIDDGFVPFPEHEGAAIPDFIAPPTGMPGYLRDLWWTAIVDATGYDGTFIINRYRAETGSKWGQGATPIPYRLENCVGRDRLELEAFAAWFNAHIWRPV